MRLIKIFSKVKHLPKSTFAFCDQNDFNPETPFTKLPVNY